MKKIYFFLVLVALFVSGATASAQFVNNSAGRTSSSASSEIEAVFNTVDLTYSPMSLSGRGGDDSDMGVDFNAFSLNWTQARAVTSAYPIYVQYGAGIQYAWKVHTEGDGDDKYKDSVTFLNVKLPVNVMYSFRIPSTDITLLPYLGLNLQGYILGQEKITWEYQGKTQTQKANLFSDEDSGGNPYNRFLVGWQIGAKVAFKKYFAGIAYEGPISNFRKQGDIKITTSQVNISIGMMF